MANIGESDGDSDYVESAENSPTSLSNLLDLVVHIIELEEMHEVAECDIIEFAQSTVISPRIDELEILELNDANTDPPENHQDNDATPTVNTQPSLPHSPMEGTSVSSATPPPHPCIEAGNASLQVQ